MNLRRDKRREGLMSARKVHCKSPAASCRGVLRRCPFASIRPFLSMRRGPTAWMDESRGRNRAKEDCLDRPVGSISMHHMTHPAGSAVCHASEPEGQKRLGGGANNHRTIQHRNSIPGSSHRTPPVRLGRFAPTVGRFMPSLLFAAIVSWGLLPEGMAQTNYARLKSFGIPDPSGANPYSQLIQGSDGQLYGTDRKS